MALEAKLDNFFGPLAEVVSRFKFGTWRTSAEICEERVVDEELRDIYFWTANFGMYTVENGGVFLYFGGREANPVFNNIVEATRQLKVNGVYKPSAGEIGLVKESVKSGHTVKVGLSDLGLVVYNGELSHFSIDVVNWRSMNSVQRLVAEMVYGSMKERKDLKTKRKTSVFAEYMAELRKAGMNSVNVYVLSQNYVKSHAPQDGAVARACWLYNFIYDSFFSAVGWGVDYQKYALRGVLK
jgi:hypothetical protein